MRTNWIAYVLLTGVGAGLCRIMLSLATDEYIRMFTAISDKIIGLLT